LGVEAPEDSAVPSAFTVTNLDDSGPGSLGAGAPKQSLPPHTREDPFGKAVAANVAVAMAR
jgi:hypothetical protein